MILLTYLSVELPLSLNIQNHDKVIILIENDIIHENLKGINNLVCVSGSSFHILPLLLGFTLKATIKDLPNQ